MLERTRVLGEDLIKALERMDEVLASHDGPKGHKWKEQDWREHATRAIAHLANAVLNVEDGTEIEASHGVIRALMALQRILDDNTVSRRLCADHIQVHSSMSFSFRPGALKTNAATQTIVRDRQLCLKHDIIDCLACED